MNDISFHMPCRKSDIYVTVKYISDFLQGMWNEIVGPSINDLRRIVQANYEEISRVFSVRSGGKLVGSLFGGYLHERYRKQSDALLFVAMVMAGIGIITAPYCKVLWLMGSTFFLQGLGHGVLTTGTQIIMKFIEICVEKNKQEA